MLGTLYILYVHCTNGSGIKNFKAKDCLHYLPDYQVSLSAHVANEEATHPVIVRCYSTLQKSEREKPSATGRLQRPVKRRRTEEPSCMPKPLGSYYFYVFPSQLCTHYIIKKVCDG